MGEYHKEKSEEYTKTNHYRRSGMWNANTWKVVGNFIIPKTKRTVITKRRKPKEGDFKKEPTLLFAIRDTSNASENARKPDKEYEPAFRVQCELNRVTMKFLRSVEKG